MGVKKQLGKNVQRLRTTSGISQTELCKKLNISQAQLSRIENGNGLSLTLLEKLAVALHTTPSELLLGPDVSPTLLARFKAIESLPKRNQKTILDVIDALLLKERQQSK